MAIMKGKLYVERKGWLQQLQQQKRNWCEHRTHESSSHHALLKFPVCSGCKGGMWRVGMRTCWPHLCSTFFISLFHRKIWLSFFLLPGSSPMNTLCCLVCACETHNRVPGFRRQWMGMQGERLWNWTCRFMDWTLEINHAHNYKPSIPFCRSMRQKYLIILFLSISRSRD